jgi:hypothetical protein
MLLTKPRWVDANRTIFPYTFFALMLILVQGTYDPTRDAVSRSNAMCAESVSFSDTHLPCSHIVYYSAPLTASRLLSHAPRQHLSRTRSLRGSPVVDARVVEGGMPVAVCTDYNGRTVHGMHCRRHVLLWSVAACAIDAGCRGIHYLAQSLALVVRIRPTIFRGARVTWVNVGGNNENRMLDGFLTTLALCPRSRSPLFASVITLYDFYILQELPPKQHGTTMPLSSVLMMKSDKEKII